MTESVQVTNEDVKSSTSKSNSKTLKLSNDNADHGKTSEKSERPLTKVVVRHLPPTMTLESFLEQVSPLPPVDYMYFVKADSSLGLLSFSRAYLNFVNIQDLIIFTEKFDNYVFIDAKGNEYPAIVEFAPFQRIPKQRANRKKDPRAGTIENDPYYLEFVEALKAEEAQRKSASKTNKQHFFETTTSTSGASQKVTSTPLLEYLKARKLDKIRVKEDKINEKKKRELERKKAREERTAGRQGEGDAHPVKVATPPHARGEAVATHSPSVRHSEDKRGVREVKRRDDDRGRTRDRDVDVRSKESKRPGKSYQEERQRLNERRQACKVGGSPRADGDFNGEGVSEMEAVSPKSTGSANEGEPKEVFRRPDKVIRPSLKAQESKRTPERSRRSERKPIPSNSREVSHHKEELRKKSYAQEREQRRGMVRKDVPATSPNAAAAASASEETGTHSPTSSTDKVPEKEKTDQATSSNKGKDPRAERRIRNKDRPSIEIYRPGMGRFSRQRLEREKGSIVGSSTERDSASPSPSPSPSVSRATSVTAKASSRTPQSKNTEESAAQSEETPTQAAAAALSAPSAPSAEVMTPTNVQETGSGDSAAKTEESTKASDVAAETEDTAAKTEWVAASKTEEDSTTEDSPAKTEDSTAKTDDKTAKTEDSADKTEDSVAKPEDLAYTTEDSPAEPQNLAAKSEDSAPKTEDSPAEPQNLATKLEDSAPKTEESAAQPEDSVTKTGDARVQSNEDHPTQKGDFVKQDDAAPSAEDEPPQPSSS